METAGWATGSIPADSFIFVTFFLDLWTNGRECAILCHDEIRAKARKGETAMLLYFAPSMLAMLYAASTQGVVRSFSRDDGDSEPGTAAC